MDSDLADLDKAAHIIVILKTREEESGKGADALIRWEFDLLFQRPEFPYNGEYWRVGINGARLRLFSNQAIKIENMEPTNSMEIGTSVATTASTESSVSGSLDPAKGILQGGMKRGSSKALSVFKLRIEPVRDELTPNWSFQNVPKTEPLVGKFKEKIAIEFRPTERLSGRHKVRYEVKVNRENWLFEMPIPSARTIFGNILNKMYVNRLQKRIGERQTLLMGDLRNVR